MKNLLITILVATAVTLPFSSSAQKKCSIKTAETLFSSILNKYNTGQHNLLSESYPPQLASINYSVDQSEKKTQIAYLWPFSSTLSAGISLYKETKNKEYLNLLESTILPTLEQYWDDARTPACYQSFPTRFGESDRYYDDNIWIAIDFCHLYSLTQNKHYLDKAQQIYRFIMSGWNEELGGGVFWCEQKKTTKNSCSNAPTAVLSVLLFNITAQPHYLDQAIKTYQWTKQLFLDPTDNTYWDSMTMTGQLNKQKYAYNTGQMIQAGALLYKTTGKQEYLTDALNSAKSGNIFFCSAKAPNNNKLLLYKDDCWFNTIYFRGINELADISNQKKAFYTMRKNLDYVWNKRDKNGFINNKWHETDTPHKWLLANAAFVELIATAYGSTK